MRLFSFCIWCSCIFLLVSAQLRPVKENDEENQYMVDLLVILEDLIHIKNLVIFNGNVNLGKSYEIHKSVEQRLTESFTRPVIVVDSKIDKFMCLKNERNIAIIYFSDFHDPILNVVSQSKSSMEFAGFIFVYKPQKNFELSTSAMEFFFNWCWKKSFTLSLLIFKRNNKFEVWVYEKKPKLKIFNYLDYISGSWYKKSFRQISNMGQYRCLVVMFRRLPDTFLFNSSEQHDITGTNVSLGGKTGYFVADFMRFVNGTMEIVSVSKEEYNIASTQMSLYDRPFDIGAISVSNASLALNSPIVAVTRTCLVLPYECHIPANIVFIHLTKWSLMTFMVFYFLMNTVIRRLNNPGMSMDQALYWNLRLFFMQPMEGRCFQRIGLPTKFIEISTQMYNLLMLSIYCGALTMSMTMGFQKSKIVDVKSFLDSDLQIMVFGNKMHSYFEVNRLPMALTDRFLIVDERTRNEHLNALNNSFAYVIEENKWNQLKFMQTRLRKPKLKLAPNSLCGVQTYQRLPLRPGLACIFGLRWFMHFVLEGGLSDKWMMLGLRQAQQAGMIVQAPYEPNIIRPLRLKFFVKTFKFLMAGLMLSLTVFVMELTYVRLTRMIRNTGAS